MITTGIFLDILKFYFSWHFFINSSKNSFMLFFTHFSTGSSVVCLGIFLIILPGIYPIITPRIIPEISPGICPDSSPQILEIFQGFRKRFPPHILQDNIQEYLKEYLEDFPENYMEGFLGVFPE